MSRSSLRALTLLACGVLCAAGLAACGGADDGDSAATKAIKQTFGASATSIERGKVIARLQLDPEGLLALGGPIVVDINGPFAVGGGGGPRFDLGFVATLAGDKYRGAVISTGDKGFVKLDDRTYSVDDAFVAKVRNDADEAKASALTGTLGVDPAKWIKDPQLKANQQVSGVDTQRIGADADVPKLLDDVATLLKRFGGAAGAGFLTPALRKQIAGAVKSAKVDVWSGAEDHIVRQIAVAIAFEFPSDEDPPIAGLEAGKISMLARFEDINGAAVKIDEPKNVRPLSDVTGGGLEEFLSGLGAGLTGGNGAAAGPALLGCVTQAEGKSLEIVRCLTNLAP